MTTKDQAAERPTLEEINQRVLRWARAGRFNMPSNEEISKRLNELARAYGYNNFTIICESAYYFPYLVTKQALARAEEV